MKNNKVLIISGGNISFSFVEEYLKKESFEYIIAVDSGLVTADKLDIPVDYILGDFDSVPKEVINKYRSLQKQTDSFIIEKYNPIKDYTDTQIAIEKALELRPDEIVILGANGTRLDHTISNIQNLLIPLENNIKCSLVDDHNKLYLINKPELVYKDEVFGDYISLLPLTHIVEKVTLKGFKYSLDKYDIHLGNSIGVSNEIVEDEASIRFDAGILIVIETRD